MRIVSLVPSATDILILLGAGDEVVGRSLWCDISNPDHDSEVFTSQSIASSRGLRPDHMLVREFCAHGQPIYRLDTQRLYDLAPDLIIVGSEAAALDPVRGVVDRLEQDRRTRPEILIHGPRGIESILDSVLEIGAAIARPDEALEQVMELRTRFLSVQEWVTPFVDAGMTVGFLQWAEPLVVGGYWTVQMIERAGGRHPWNETVARAGAGAAAGSQQGERAAGPGISCTAEEFGRHAPDALIVAPCGMNLDESCQVAERLLHQNWARDLPAVKNGQVYAVDGRKPFNRPGPCFIEAFEFLVGLVQRRPELMNRVPNRRPGVGVK